MSTYEVTVKLPNGQTDVITVDENKNLEYLAKKYQQHFEQTIVLAKVDKRLQELFHHVRKDCEISFLDTRDNDGQRLYRRSVTLVMQKAAGNLWGDQGKVRVFYSLGQGYYCEMINHSFTEEDRQNLIEEMRKIVESDIPIVKFTERTDVARQIFHEMGLYDKEKLLYYRRSSSINLYNLDGMIDYFYGYMVPSTGYLKFFDIEIFEDGFVLLFPDKESQTIKPLATSKKLHHTLRTSRERSMKLNVGSIGALNDAIASGYGQSMILAQEAMMEAKIGNLADEIASHPEKKFVMIAGPSSSGKTSFANRLSIQLAARGLRPHPLGLDDYYADRELCPRNPDGTLDFECLEALDVELFNQDMSKLLNGEEIEMPSFNFKTGKREYRGKRLKLEAEDVLVIEGIHGLNDRLSHMLPNENKYRIYISALTQLNIDEHNPLPTTDARLIRRIVRDARTRGTTAQETIAMWASVRRGEEKNIFPFQDSADVMFNSALLYEIAVMKVYVEPLLFQIPSDSKEYIEAKRLLKFLDYFLPLSTEGISNNSLIREFVGGSCFNV